MAKGPLVLVDLQPAYLSKIDVEYKRIFGAVRQAIEEARQEKRLIIVVEMAHHAGTHKEVMDLLAGYDRTFSIVKRDLSGAAQIKKECDLRGEPTEVFSLGGVAAAVCVYDTALGLASAYPDARIEMIKELCDTPYDGWGVILDPRVHKVRLRNWHPPRFRDLNSATTDKGEADV